MATYWVHFVSSSILLDFLTRNGCISREWVSLEKIYNENKHMLIPGKTSRNIETIHQSPLVPDNRFVRK